MLTIVRLVEVRQFSSPCLCSTFPYISSTDVFSACQVSMKIFPPLARTLTLTFLDAESQWESNEVFDEPTVAEGFTVRISKSLRPCT